MADIQQQIHITAVGGEEAAAALGSVDKAMGNIVGTHRTLANAFQERFQHIGLMLFAGDALRASGLGREARMVVSTLNLALTELGAAAGLSSGGLMLVVAALSAAVGIGMKVIESHKNQSEELTKLVDSEEKEMKSLNDSIAVIEEYKKKVGEIPPTLEDVLTAKKALREFEAAVEIETLHQQIEATATLVIQEEAERLQIEKNALFVQHLTLAKFALLAISQGLTPAIQALISKHEDFGKILQENAKAMLENNVKLQEAKNRLSELTDKNYDAAKAIKDREKAVDEEAKAEEEANKETLKLLNEAAEQSYATFEKEQKAHEAMVKKMEDQAKSTFNTINNEQSKAFAKMVVEGQSFSQATAHMWRDIAEQVIAQIERMLVEWAIWMAATGGTGVASGGFSGAVGKMLGFASGGEVLVDKPTIMLAGEGGEPELATFTPLSKMGAKGSSMEGGAGGVTINIGTIQSNAYGVNDPDQLATDVGQKIVERIRGRGDLNFARVA